MACLHYVTIYITNNSYFVSDCFLRVHKSWAESREDLVSHILRCVVAASDSQAVQPSGAGRREGVLQRAKEGRCQHMLLSLQGRGEKYRRAFVERDMYSNNWITSEAAGKTIPA